MLSSASHEKLSNIGDMTENIPGLGGTDCGYDEFAGLGAICGPRCLPGERIVLPSVTRNDALLVIEWSAIPPSSWSLESVISASSLSISRHRLAPGHEDSSEPRHSIAVSTSDIAVVTAFWSVACMMQRRMMMAELKRY